MWEHAETTDKCLEWAALKMRLSVYDVPVPEWVPRIEVPTWEQIDVLERYLISQVDVSQARRLSSEYRARSSRRGTATPTS